LTNLELLLEAEQTKNSKKDYHMHNVDAVQTRAQ